MDKQSHRLPANVTKRASANHGAPCPALQRLEDRGWIAGKWGFSSNNSKRRFYWRTAAGRKELVTETMKWERMARAIGRILEPETAEE